MPYGASLKVASPSGIRHVPGLDQDAAATTAERPRRCQIRLVGIVGLRYANPTYGLL